MITLKMKLYSIVFILILTNLFLVSAQEDIIWGESSTNIMLSEEELENLPIINDEQVIDWEMGGIVAGIIILLIIGYRIKNRKKQGEKKKRVNVKKKKK